MAKEIIIERVKTEGMRRILRLIEGSVGAIIYDEGDETRICTFEDTHEAVIPALEIEGIEIKRVEEAI